MSDQLRITEIFYSLQGEARSVGLPTTFVRLTGCPLRCGYCDTAYAFSGGTLMTQEEVVARVAAFPARAVTVTGGEPLAQPACLPLLTRLYDEGHDVSLETSGAIDLEAVDPRIVKVMDLKTPGSGELARTLYHNVEYLTPQDQVKFVICDRDDYDWARFKVAELDLHARVGDILFSPSAGQLAPTQLADWIVADRLQVRLQIQLHKLLWGDRQGV